METKNKDLINTFYYLLPNNGSTEGLNSTTRRYEEAKQCALIAEDFAIGFAEWIENYTYHKKHNVWIKNDSLTVGKTTTKELLEIYKKEKGL